MSNRTQATDLDARVGAGRVVVARAECIADLYVIRRLSAEIGRLSCTDRQKSGGTTEEKCSESHILTSKRVTVKGRHVHSMLSAGLGSET